MQYHNGYYNSTAACTENTWYNVAAIYENGLVSLYVDGVYIGNKSYGQGTPDGSTVRFGRHNSGDPQWINGIIDEVAIWDTALSAEAKWGFYKFCRKEGDFAEAIGAVLQDGETVRTVLGATNGAPIVIDGPYSDDAVRAAINEQTDMDTYDRQIHFVAAKRAAMISGVRAA